MSWPLISLAVLGVALAAGFVWYERGHPSARVLALVGTLAALAVLGRIAFAPLPNVKPTTDIVLIAGYALGGAPGFVVGAITALVSNFFYGQGPWTPWQMAAWGAVGIGGAVLARMTARRLGRLPLALACAAAGLGYGFVLDVSTWINFTGGATSGTLGAVLISAAPFDAAHAIGNFLFCLAFGPALVRAVSRFRDRFQVRWRPVA
jgi:energy-coupling factor transport system substrate-specific component